MGIGDARVVIGAIAGFLPCVIGRAVMARLGTRNIGSRLPVAWALVGGLAAGWAAAAMAPDSVAPFATTGAICALLCRTGMRWGPDGSA